MNRAHKEISKNIEKKVGKKYEVLMLVLYISTTKAFPGEIWEVEFGRQIWDVFNN